MSRGKAVVSRGMQQEPGLVGESRPSVGGWRRWRLQRLDRYIIQKFLSTFFFMIGVFCIIAVVFDLMENLTDLINNRAPIGATLLYYLSFCFYFGNLLSGFIVFLTIIWFTSRMAQQSEVIAMLSGGMGYARFLRPYFIAGGILCGMAWWIGNWILPHANRVKVDFEMQYIHVDFSIADQHIFREITPGSIAYFRTITVDRATGYRFQYEQWNDRDRMTQQIHAAKATWMEETGKWRLVNASIRDFRPDGSERFRYLTRFDTTLAMRLEDFGQRSEWVATMTTPQLAAHIEKESARGIPVTNLQLERYGRTANAFSILVLTLIGVSIASRKQRGGMGTHLFLAVLVGFAFVFTAKLISVYAASAILPPGFPIPAEQWLRLAAWLPNGLFAALGGVIYWKAPK
jgi:lipopolysaccharide export system permease protein